MRASADGRFAVPDRALECTDRARRQQRGSSGQRGALTRITAGGKLPIERWRRESNAETESKARL